MLFKHLHSMDISDESHHETKSQIVVIMVPLPAQSHLNQLLQLSCQISSYGLPVYYAGSAIHNRQAKARANGLDPKEVARIRFHDMPLPPFACPPPDPNSTEKFPLQLLPAWDAMLSLREPFAAYFKEMSRKFRRIVIVRDTMMSVVVQDAAFIDNAETYTFNCVSAIFLASCIWANLGKPLPIDHIKLPPLEFSIPEELQDFVSLQFQHNDIKDGDIHNTCRLIEGPFMDLLEREEIRENRKNWAIGPILPSIVSSSVENKPESQHRCFQWLDKQEPNSVIFVSFGTTTSLPDEQIKEIALGLEQSKVKFLWVLRDADKGDIFDGQVRRAELPEGFEDRIEGVGLVIRDWAPQPQILSHQSTGGFMSHCGWNSCIESITMGVPIAAWPMHSDQPINSLLITDILKMGLNVRESSQKMEIVKASTIENVVRILMATEEGHEIRKRVEELGCNTREATQPGGASRLELDSFIAHITR